jgi:hypothetical protein
LVEGGEVVERKEELLKHGVLDANVHLPPGLITVKGSRRPEVDSLVLRKMRSALIQFTVEGSAN